MQTKWYKMQRGINMGYLCFQSNVILYILQNICSVLKNFEKMKILQYVQSNVILYMYILQEVHSLFFNTG